MRDSWTTLREQLELFSKPFPKQAIAFANSHRDELAPHLIEVLAQVAANPVVPDGYMLHEYALQLLAAWADPRAYAPMVALGHHDEDTLDALLGDTVTESYGRCLASVCDGDLAPLKALFEDTKASFWARSAALDAMVVRVIEGDYPRDALVQYLIAHGDSEAQRLRTPGLVRDLEVIDCIVTAACDLVALEMRERIEGWFDEGLLDIMYADRPWVAVCMAKTFESERQATLERGKGYVRDVEAQMGWWACFAEERPESLMPRDPWSNPRSDFLEAGQTVVRSAPKIGRNDACPCGSGKKYKKCCGMS